MTTPHLLSDTLSRLNTARPDYEQLGSLSAINAWKSAHSALEFAIQQFVDASSRLKSFCSVNCHASSSISALLIPHNDVERRIQSLASGIRDLRQALSTALAAQNRCPQYVVINRLPRELISHILHLSVTAELQNLRQPNQYSGIPMEYQRRETDRITSYPIILSGVCKAWRDLVLGTPVLWSYIDLMAQDGDAERSYARANLFISRAGNCSLDVRIHEIRGTQYTTKIVEWLTPVMPRVCCLDLPLSGSSFLTPILRCWAQHATSGIMKMLNVGFMNLGGDNTSSPLLDPLPSGFGLSVSKQRLEEIVYPITRLTLTGASFDWDSQAYHRLTHLKLNRRSIRATEFRAILLNSPQLRILSLGLYLVDDEAETRYSPVHLPHLETFVYDRMPVADWPLLRMIAPTPSLRKLKLGFAREAHARTELGGLTRFLRGSAITTLYIAHSPHFTFDLLDYLPLLQRLGLEDCRIHDMSGDCPLFDPEHAFPQFRELCLISCRFPMEWLEELSRFYPMLALRISDVEIWKGNRQMTDKEALETLPKIFSDVQCNYYKVVRGWNPPSHWDFAAIS